MGADGFDSAYRVSAEVVIKDHCRMFSVSSMLSTCGELSAEIA